MSDRLHESFGPDPLWCSIVLSQALVPQDSYRSSFTSKEEEEVRYDKASTSVTLVSGAGEVVWSYSVNKGRGEKNRQSLAEAIAKHLKDDYLQKKK